MLDLEDLDEAHSQRSDAASDAHAQQCLEHHVVPGALNPRPSRMRGLGLFLNEHLLGQRRHAALV